MKRFIFAVLIPCLLIQLFGCSSLSEIPVEELKDYSGEEVRITTKDSANYLLRKDLTSDEIINNPDIYCSDNWSINPELGNINIIYKKPYNKDGESDKLHFKVDKTNISYNDISSVSVQRIFEIPTSALVIALAVVLFVGVLVLKNNPIVDFDN